MLGAWLDQWLRAFSSQQNTAGEEGSFLRVNIPFPQSPSNETVNQGSVCKHTHNILRTHKIQSLSFGRIDPVTG